MPSLCSGCGTQCVAFQSVHGLFPQGRTPRSRIPTERPLHDMGRNTNLLEPGSASVVVLWANAEGAGGPCA